MHHTRFIELRDIIIIVDFNAKLKYSSLISSTHINASLLSDLNALFITILSIDGYIYLFVHMYTQFQMHLQ